MAKRPMPPLDSHKPGKRKNPGESVKKLQTRQVLARDIPRYFRGEPPLDPESFVYVRVEMLWPALGRASLVDISMFDVKDNPARFFAFFTGDCTGFFGGVTPLDKLCLYLSDATISEVEERCKQDTLNLPFALTWDKKCMLKYVEREVVGRSITFPTRA